jgi:hypothetical protein
MATRVSSHDKVLLSITTIFFKKTSSSSLVMESYRGLIGGEFKLE